MSATNILDILAEMWLQSRKTKKKVIIDLEKGHTYFIIEELEEKTTRS